MNGKALIAEFIGTFALVFTCIGAAASHYMTGGQGGGLLINALAPGLTIAVMASATLAVSGGHLNPAVTIALFLTQKIDILNAIGYIIVQCLGAIAAAGVIKFCLPHSVLTAVGMSTPTLGNGISISMGLLTEIILTFFLVFVIYGTVVDKRAPKVGTLFIGLAVTMGILIGDPITGAAMNPARHLGPALLGGDLQNLWLYWAGPIMGGILAGWCYTRFLDQ